MRFILSSVLFTLVVLCAASCAALSCEQRADLFVSSATAAVTVGDFAADAADDGTPTGKAQTEAVRAWLSDTAQVMHIARDRYIRNCHATTTTPMNATGPAEEVGTGEPTPAGSGAAAWRALRRCGVGAVPAPGDTAEARGAG